MAHLDTAERRGARRDPSTVVGRLTLRRELPLWWPLPILVIALLGAWELVARVGWIDPVLFPPPTVIVSSFVHLVTEGDSNGITLQEHTLVTLYRVLWGVLLGGVAGLAFGWVMGWSRRAKAMADPIVATVHPIPKIALFPLMTVIFGIGELSKVVGVAIAVFFPVLINAMTGVAQISPIHFEVARNLGLSRRRVLIRVVIPGSLPVVMAGFRLALNIGILITVAIELLGTSRGIGWLLQISATSYRPERMYACLIVLAAIGLATNLFVLWLTRRLVPWRAESR